VGDPVPSLAFLVNETNRRTELQFYWYYNSTCFGQPFCPSSGVLSRISALVHFCRFDDRLLPGAGWNMQFHPAPGSKRSSNLQKCTNADIRLRTPDDGQKGCPKHVELLIPIKLEFSASVGFIH